MRAFIVLIIVALFGLTLEVQAQGGSNYSALGIGDLRTSVGGVYDAMGGTSIAIPTPYSINVVNPALLGMATTTRIQVGYRFNQHVIKNGDQTLAQNNGNIDGVLALFSVDTAHGFGITVGVLPYSKVAYSTERNLSTSIGSTQVVGRSTQLGEGGVSQLHLGSSVRITPSLYFGLSMGALFGVMTYTDDVTVDGPFYRVTSSQAYDLRGLLFRGGLYWEATPWLNIGAYFSGGGEGSVFITRKASGYGSGIVYYDTTAISQTTTPLPMSFGVGLSSRIGRSMIGADVEVGQYEDMTINVRTDAGYANALRASIGYSRPSSLSPTSTLSSKIGYHAGLSYQQLYTTFNGNNIEEYTGGGGISFPLGGNAMVDAGLNMGWRGPTGEETLNEFVARLTVTVSIGETWFKPFARE